MSEVSRQDDENARQWARFESHLVTNLAQVTEFRSMLGQLGDPGTTTLPVLDVSTERRLRELQKASLFRRSRYVEETVNRVDQVGEFVGWELTGRGVHGVRQIYELRDPQLTLAELPWSWSAPVLLVDGRLANFEAAELGGPDYYTTYSFSNTPSISRAQAAAVITGNEAAQVFGLVEPDVLTSFLATLVRDLRAAAARRPDD